MIVDNYKISVFWGLHDCQCRTYERFDVNGGHIYMVVHPFKRQLHITFIIVVYLWTMHIMYIKKFAECDVFILLFMFVEMLKYYRELQHLVSFCGRKEVKNTKKNMPRIFSCIVKITQLILSYTWFLSIWLNFILICRIPVAENGDRRCGSAWKNILIKGIWLAS